MKMMNTMKMSVMCQDGDSEHFWDPQDQQSTQLARAVFDKHKKEGFLAFRMNGAGHSGEQMKAFDPHAGSIILVPPIAGG
jgi:hypothetical protein